MNRLADESSPYLRQHAANPVDWYPWGEAALARAREENRPILLSIGYAACHWCHVMAHESFEDPDTARVMNEHFVNIKVDREERPDLDGIYMRAVQAMTGSGGWPMTVFLTPAGEPFWGGTYFPPQDTHGLPSFRRVLTAVADAYRERPDQIRQTVNAMRELYDTAGEFPPVGSLSRGTLETAFALLAQTFDASNGGFGRAPKFPPTMALEFLLTRWARTGSQESLDIARLTFARMSAGGIHDHVGGGFHRYTVDAHWLVPHFEKMLYDNALLARLGAHLWQATGDAAVRETTENILRWVAREMTSEDGGFYASLDADSDGHEGLFYTWTEKELDDVLGEASPAVREWFGVTADGNFEGRNILHARPDAGEEPAEVTRALPRLYDVRAQRTWPGLDDKVIASWNGLMLRGIATCARVFGNDEWNVLARSNAGFLASRLVNDDRVWRIWAGGAARVPGFLEDYAAVALGFLEMWQLTHEREWLDRARTLSTAICTRFWSDDLPGFYDVPSDHEVLVARARDVTDNATPSGSSLAAELLLRLGYITGDAEFARIGHRAVESLAESMARHPHAFGHLLTCADFVMNGPIALAVVGHPVAAGELLAPASDVYLPSLIIGATLDGADGDLSFFADRGARGSAAAYVCRGTVCGAPASTPAEVHSQLMELSHKT